MLISQITYHNGFLLYTKEHFVKYANLFPTEKGIFELCGQEHT